MCVLLCVEIIFKNIHHHQNTSRLLFSILNRLYKCVCLCVVGKRQKPGELSSGPGRERTACFFWQGSQSSVSGRGTSALMTVELGNHRGAQVSTHLIWDQGSVFGFMGGGVGIELGKAALGSVAPG